MKGKSMSAQNKGGRPRKYTPKQAEEAIDRIEARGNVADGASVKEVMHEELGVSPGIDVTILGAEVERICRVRAEERAKLLLAKLPARAKDAAVEVGNEITRAVTAVLAEQFDQLNRASRKREAELEEDLRVFRRRVQDLDAQIAEHEALHAADEEKNHDLAKQSAAKDVVIADLNAQVAQFGSDADLEGRFVEIVRGFLAGNIQKVCQDE